MSSLNKIETLIPLEELEAGAVQQIFENAKLDFVKKMAIMPDCHQGYDLPIGAVALTDGVISPSYVGYDIGCGMCYVNTGVPVNMMFEKEEDKTVLYHKIVDGIPLGYNGHSTPRDYPVFKSASGNKSLTNSAGQKMPYQLGTLGSGNHFIEIGENQNGFVCITVHSGSRRGGWEIGDWYMKQGRFFELGTELASAYIHDMNFALQFALDNRLAIINNTLRLMGFDMHGVFTILNGVVNENHNHAVLTDNGVLHRKGATPADAMQTGIIPANMRDGVYITIGLGNEKYLSSASHGCGRTMGRNQAKKTLDYDKFKNDMDGIVASVDRKLLDEAPDAYKDVNMVINSQKGIVVDVIDFIKPLINIKGV